MAIFCVHYDESSDSTETVNLLTNLVTISLQGTPCSYEEDKADFKRVHFVKCFVLKE
jgi:hypothetical protein